MYGPRVVGTFLCGLIIVSTIFSKASYFELALLAINSLVWAHVAYGISMFSKESFRAEKNNFLFDSIFCGFWMALICLNPIASATIFSMVAMSNVAVGGAKQLLKGFALKLFGFFVAVCFFGFCYKEGTESDVWLCLPLIIIYPMVLGFSFYELAFELRESKSKLRTLSRTDPLTGLLNRRYWSDLVSDRLNQKQLIYNSAVIIIDVDHFKSVNDIYGHAAGDQVLRILARLLTLRTRAVDSICRYGGDEFCVFIFDTSISIVTNRMSEVSVAFSDECKSLFPSAHATLSIGIAAWNIEVSDVDSWISTADKKLYRAKREGRNKIIY